jgi:hypothetical protein
MDNNKNKNAINNSETIGSSWSAFNSKRDINKSRCVYNCWDASNNRYASKRRDFCNCKDARKVATPETPQTVAATSTQQG